ncbi:MAG: phenylalanine--tRNA ligase subunit beta, partial [Fimbriimonadaceae bacterium]|nr:phenylalanine--tRNA ligase subunit beta [Alphaproteobacteria bacterium]
MKFTLSWLKDHLDTDASLQEIADTLTMIGLEVEAIDNPAEKYAAFKVAYVESAEQHPDADRLRVCMVNTGSEMIQVVCGAPNARTGMKGVFAPSGSVVPGTGVLLKKSSIRGVESNGMLVSEREMGLSDEHEGIIELDEGAEVGKPFAEVMGLDDPMIEIAITPNRPDCLGVYGIARDLAAAGVGKLKDKPIVPVSGEYEMPIKVLLDLGEEAHLCPAFAVRHVRGLKNGSSPAWLQQRLRAIGLRPINALVDITNYVTYDRGRPLHVFDANKVAGNLVVRDAHAGEKILALDGREYMMSPGMVVIADDDGPESIGGIMGGEHTGCDENTTDVLIESALWDAVNIATTGRTLGVQSDARFRFERGVDPAFTVPGAELATRLVLDFCGGTPSELTVAGSVPDSDKIIELPISEVIRLLGLDVSRNEIKVILTSLGFWVAGTGED